jgi:hypothetical protein
LPAVSLSSAFRYFPDSSAHSSIAVFDSLRSLRVTAKTKRPPLWLIPDQEVQERQDSRYLDGAPPGTSGDGLSRVAVFHDGQYAPGAAASLVGQPPSRSCHF